MKRRADGGGDPIENEIELAFRPGAFVRDGGCYEFVSGLEEVAAKIDALAGTAPARAAGLYETFFAGCHQKAEELDDSSAYFGMFARELVCRWVKARQAAGAGPNETASRVLAWMDDDPYAFCSELEKDVAKTFNKAGLAAFEQLARARWEEAPAQSGYGRRRWNDVLRAVYLAQRNIAAYVALAEQTGLHPRDCLELTKFFMARRPEEALAWAERGIEADRKSAAGSMAGYELVRLKRGLLVKLGREDEALEGAWSEYAEHPSKYSYEDLMQFVPRAQRRVWHEKAMETAKGGDLHSLMELFLETHEMERLANLVRGTTNEELERVTHFATEPAAMKLEKHNPELAARIWRAQGMRIVEAGKSKYYDAALSNFERARECYARAGLAAEWEAIVSQVRASHRRKIGFMSGFESVAAGAGSKAQPSFLERAKARWGGVDPV